MTEAAIEIRGLSKTFVNEAGEEVSVLRGLDLTVAPGEFLCVLGPTGGGKTTLLRLLTGLTPATSGHLRVGGSAPGRGDPVGMVFQQNSLFPWRRVLANVTFPLTIRGIPRREAKARAREMLGLVRLGGAENAWPYELSGGMQQRAAIARALAAGGEILLLDEPFGALDEETRRALQEVLLRIHERRRMTVVFVTHNIEEALLLGNRIVVLGGGRIVAEERVRLPRPRDRLSPEFTEALIRLRRVIGLAPR